MRCLSVWMAVGVCLGQCLSMPPHHRGWLRLWEDGDSCGPCVSKRCPPAPSGCPAGLVRDRCGCCQQCGNAEGQPCDLDGSQEFYGRCGEGLRCRERQRGRGDDPEPRCVCLRRGLVCGSDGRTYPNVCQLNEESSRKGVTLHEVARGPCYSAPRISRAPRDSENYTGSDIVFGCEVTAYPLPSLGWKKKGSANFLPGDDPHVSVQMRGGPQRCTVSTWLQIHGLRLSDAGVYSCISHNALGQASLSARLSVVRKVVSEFSSGLDDKYESSEGLEDELDSRDYMG